MRETTHRSNGLLGEIEISCGILWIVLGADAVDLEVCLRPMEISALTSASDSVSDTGGMPGTNASNFTQTAVGLPRQTRDAPPGDDTLEAMTLGDTDAVDHLVLVENAVDIDGALEETLGVLDLVRDRPAVDLDLHEVGLLLRNLDLTDLGVHKKANNCAMLDDPVELGIDIGGTLGVLLCVLGESLLLRLVPILVEATFDLIREMLSPDGGEGAETVGSLDVADDADGNDRRCLDDADGLYNLFLVKFGPRLIDVAHNVGHARLVAHEGSEMARLRRVILRECLDLAAMARSTLLRQEGERSMPRGFELPVRHRDALDETSVKGKRGWEGTEQLSLSLKPGGAKDPKINGVSDRQIAAPSVTPALARYDQKKKLCPIIGSQIRISECTVRL